MIQYEHVQRGRLGWLALVFVLAMGSVLLFASDELPGPAVIAVVAGTALIALIIVVASTLTVTVSSDDVVLAFGWGWPKKRIPRLEIITHEPVRNHWILGWGIRWFPGGTMWNVWGLDAIELQLANGRRFRIGTDDVPGLTQALMLR